MKKTLWLNIISLIISAFIFINMIVITILGITAGADSNQPGSSNSIGINFFRFYTTDSNLLAAICMGFVMVFSFINIIKKKDEMPHSLMTFELICASAVMLTFLTTSLFLAPTYAANGHNYFALFRGNLFFMHFLNPVLVFIMVVFIHGYYKFNWLDRILTLSTIMVYGPVYTIMVLTKNWNDFYGFTFGGHYWVISISLLVMFSSLFAIGLGISFLHNLIFQKKNK